MFRLYISVYICLEHTFVKTRIIIHFMEMTSNTNPKTYKYKVDYYLRKLPKDQYDVARNTLAVRMKVHVRTIDKYRYTKINSHYSIPSEHLFILANFFGVSMVDMFEQAPEVVNREQLIEEHKEKTFKDYNS